MSDWAERKPSIVFECDDTQATFDVMKGKGVEVTQELQKMACGTFATFRDTDGNEFLL